MADSKITALAALTGANVATNDVLTLVDISDATMDASGTNKKITADELRKAMAALGLVSVDALWDTKGDLAVATGADAASKLAVGADGTVLQADSSQATGLKWATRSRSISDTHTDTTVNNSTTETVLASQAVPTTVAAGDVLRLTVVGDLLNSSGSAVTYTWKAILGATTVQTSNALSEATGASRRQWRHVIEALVVSTSDQRLSIASFVNNNSANWVMSTAVTNGTGFGTATEDLTAGKNLQLSVTLGTASSSAEVVSKWSLLEVIKR